MVKRHRLDLYEPNNDISDPEKTGLVPNQAEYDLATPNLSRLENILIVASNSSLNEAVLAKFKWRPQKLPDGRQLVSLISRLTFVYDNDRYEFEEFDTYEPQISPIRLDRIIRYGSKASKLRLIISAPYRRLRLLFTGHLTSVSDNQKRVFLKLNCVMNPNSDFFDFLDQYNLDCVKQIYELRKPTMSLNDTIANLLVHDRHEHKIRMNGEFLFVVDDSTNTRTKKAFTYYGFHSRHFVGSNTDGTGKQTKDLKTKRIYALMNNGQAFHIGHNELIPEQTFDFGYTTFQILPTTKPINKPIDLDWDSISGETEKFALHVSGQGKTFECSGQRLGDYAPQWFRVSTNGFPGWAWVSLDDELTESSRELELIGESLKRFEFAPSTTVKLNDGLLLDSSSGQNESMPLVVSISEQACSSSQLVGSKASSLNHLLAFAQAPVETNSDSKSTPDYMVPNGFVLTKYAHELIIKENPSLVEKINTLHQLIAESQMENLKEDCKLLLEFVDSLRLPERINDKLVEVFTNYYGNLDNINQISFAVRSSSWGEDEEDMSAAGQLTTLLNVRGLDALAKASMACYASKFSYENIEYKRQHGLPLDLPMAVVIQEMVACEKAGVLFTCDPTTGDDSRMTISANYGLGESVVSAQTDPDSIKVRITTSNDLIIESVHIGEKKVIIKGDPSNGDNTDQFDRSKCCLNDEEILKLARVGLKLRETFRTGQRDIEWGYLNGQLYLFQSRPVTGLESYSIEELMHESERPGQAEKFFYSRANIGEVAPFANRPLNLTYFIYFWNVVGNHLHMRLHSNIEYLPICATEVFHETYHSYFNLNGSALLSLGCGLDKPLVVRAMEIALFGHEIPPQPDIIEANRGFDRMPELFHGTRFYLETLAMRLMPVTTVEKFRPAVNRLEANVQNIRLAHGFKENKMLGLFNQMKRVYNDFVPCWTNHIYVVKLASTNNMRLTSFLSKYIKDPLQLTAASNKFLAITPDVVSAQIPARVTKIAKLIRSMGQDEIDKFTCMPAATALAYVKNLDGSQDEYRKSLAKEFYSLIERFGHRCYNEFELADKSWRENPTQLVDMIKQNCKQNATQPNDNNKLKTFNQVLESLNIQLGFWDRLVLRYSIVPTCQQFLAAREITKDLLIKLVDIARQASRMLADELCRNSRLPDPDLLHYVFYDEIDPLVRDHQPSIVIQAIRRRNMFKKIYAEPWLYDEIITDLTPNNFKPTQELEAAISDAPKLFGTPASSGRIQAKICLVNGFKEIDRVQPGTILLTHSTDIAFSPIFPLISGIITEVGGLISHGAVVAREYGLPSIIGIPGVTRILQDGEEVILDADNGTIIRLGKIEGANDEPTKALDGEDTKPATQSNGLGANSH